MKKILKISLLILFIIFVLGITTSNASNTLKIEPETSAKEMIEWLSTDGNYITGISDKLRDDHAALYCREKNVWLYDYATYSIESSNTYPDDDLENGYARAYVLAAPGYIKSDKSYGAPTISDERQWAWYYFEGDTTTPNDLVTIALAYQEFKTTEQDFSLLKGDIAETTLSDELVVYGPIQIEYSYASATSGSHFDEWGGFNYAFFDEKGTNISNKVQLCTLENDIYTPIQSTQITSDDKDNGYYKVRTSDYNDNVDLYIVTTDKTITNVSIKLQANTKDYSATVYKLSGTIQLSSNGYNFCNECRYNVVNSISEAIGNSNKYYMYNNNYYVWSKSEINKDIGRSYPSIYSTVKFDNTNSYMGGLESDYEIRRSHYCTICMGECTNIVEHKPSMSTKYWYRMDYYYFTKKNGCGKWCSSGKGSWQCGSTYTAGPHDSQGLLLIDTAEENSEIIDDTDIELEFRVAIEVTKVWDDASDIEEIRPDNISLKVYRSTDQTNWTLLTENTDYIIEWTDKAGDSWKAIITNLLRIDENGNEYFFKVEEENSSNHYEVSYTSGTYIDGKVNSDDSNITITNAKLINIGGYVWLDGQTGIKPAVPNNGIMDDSEQRLENIVVYLYHRDSNRDTMVKIAETKTDSNGHYVFENLKIGNYYIEFEYDGVHYEDTISVENGSSKAFENDIDRNTFNGRFGTITYKQSNDGTTLNYEYADKKSTLITNQEGSTKIADAFIMNAETKEQLISSAVDNLNLGLVKRGTDIATSTDIHDAKVSINGQQTIYTYNKEDNSIVIDQTQTSERVTYNLNLYASDYNYRIRNYVNTQNFTQKDKENSGVTTGNELKVYTTYELNIQNQSTETTRINEVKYVYDEKYAFVGLQDSSYSVYETGNILTINLNGLSLTGGQTQTLHLIFEVKDNNSLVTGDFYNKAEVTSYSTDKGLIDIDSQPGNCINDNQCEDDCDKSGGLKARVIIDERTISGKVFDTEGNNVNDVIVQLIELKTVNDKIYEYIWQETVSGTEKGLRLNADGSALEQYSYNKADGYYEFKGFIPGDYIVRFIYGDGSTYDMTENVIKYNGQDYKSMPDANYNAEWYNTSTYSEGASVARDNEARRLETIAYSVEVNSLKGVLLKLLNNVSADALNLTEKEILVAAYNFYYDPDITFTKIEDVSDDDINNAITKLLKDVVLNNTWMAAETSKIKVPVADNTEGYTNTNAATIVDGIYTINKFELQNINFGLELRPVTKIELKKYITGFKLIAANGQTLVNAYVDVYEYLTDEYKADPSYINNKVQGIKDNVTILDTVWQYEVVPTEINTIVDGANLEFEYTFVVENTGETDYLSTELADAYANNSVADYKTLLTTRASEIKTAMRNDTYRAQIGNSVGTSYYVGGTGSRKVLTEVTDIRDYVNNDLTFVFSYEGKVDIDEDAPKTHRILRDDYSMQETTLNTILKTTESTGKMSNTDSVVMYTVNLGKNPISSTGKLEFDTYIAEVMRYTNAAGRRAMTSTPGNAEIIDSEKRDGKSHEIDEADTGRIQIGSATGEDVKTNYIIIISVALGIAIVALGAYIVKKYFMK